MAKSESPVATALRDVIAAVDVGSTSVRARVCELLADGSLRPLDEFKHPISIGTDTFRVGRVTPRTMHALCDVLKRFIRSFAGYGVSSYLAVGTSAIRDASNQDMLVDRVRHETGVRLKVLDAVEEGRLTYQVLLPFLRENVLAGGIHTMLLDLGGGSTEVTVLQGDNLVFTGSRRLGIGRLFHSVACQECGDTQRLLASVIHNVVTSTLALCRSYPIKRCVVVNPLLLRVFGQATRARALDAAGSGIRLPLNAARSLIAKGVKLPPDELAERYELTHSEADLLSPALLILEQFLAAMRLQRLYFADADMLLSLMHDLLAERGGVNPLAAFGRQIVNSARSIGERYHYHATHARHVAFLCDALFESLAGFLDLAPRDRLYLHLGAILHDIGMYVSERSHHKHSHYLVSWSEIAGLAQSERKLVALITRYHRKALPAARHLEYASLTKPERMRVCKLAALLRMADALDRAHSQAVTAVEAVLRDDELLLLATADTDLSVESAALRGKADLFEEITGVRVCLRRQT